ncbi:hypothetical protein ACVNF4_07025 [Streptomyces sp. S6]
MIKRKNVAFCAAALMLAAGGWFGYQEIFTKGLERLPSKICDGGVSREIITHTLPKVRSAEESSNTVGSGYGFTFSCRVYAGDSIFSGESEIQRGSQAKWKRYYESNAADDPVKRNLTSTGNIHAMSADDFASVYVPCVPSDINPSDTTQTYALIADVRVIGKSRLTGLALRQAKADFAYELTRRAYTLGKCQGNQNFPEELPRFKDN